MKLNKGRVTMIRFALTLSFVATVFGANWALMTFGFVPVWFGLAAPAGVYFSGIGFTLRDLLHDVAGRRWVIAAIFIGATVSGVLSGRLAIASGVAFLVSELADFAVYEPLRRHHWLIAVAASNAVGLLVDSALFLWLAFGSLAFIEGQVIGKAYMTVIAVICLWGFRAVSQRRYSARVITPAPRMDGDA